MATIIFPPKKSIFQRITDKIHSTKTPAWLLSLTETLMPVLKQALNQLGQEAIETLKTLVTEASIKNMTGKEKKAWVIEKFRNDFFGVKDSILNAVIENLVLTFKISGKF